ncbi:hypothetical protein P43SY_005793 [Pythium insidiosum]|uniref:Mitochondrial protein n=1 Tax=Pythium insidiosum TaxID=114742 RepID=A0AAD5QD27_PYTIN|nr:hypothetical protein P43SY_005793 [Pythium insidiosum]
MSMRRSNRVGRTLRQALRSPPSLRRQGSHANRLLLAPASSSQSFLRRHSASISLRPLSTSASTSTHEPVPRDDFETLKAFLMQPATEGDSAAAARSILAQMMQRHVYASMSGQESAVMSMVADALDDPALVVHVYLALRRAGVEPTPVTLELTAEACARVGDWDSVRDVIDEMHRAVDLMHPSLEIYENAVRACRTAQRWMQGKQLLAEMRQYGLEASPEIHLEVIETTVACKEITATTQLFQDFLAAFPYLESDEVLEVLEDLRHLAVEQEALPHAVFFRDQIVARQGEVSAGAYEAMIHLAARLGRWHEARVLFAQLTRARTLPIAPPSHQYTRDVDQLLHDLPEHGLAVPLAVFNAALRAFGGTTQRAKAEALLVEMRARGVQPDSTSFAALLCSCGSDLDASQQHFDEWRASGLPVTLDVLHAYVLAASRAKAWNTVLDRFAMAQDVVKSSGDSALSQAFARDARIQSLLAVAHGHLGNDDEMLHVFTTMKVHGLVPNLYVYAAAMTAYTRKGQWRHALMLFDHTWHEEGLSRERLTRFPLLWDAAIEAAIAGDDTERLRALYSQVITRQGEIRPHTAALLIAHMRDVPTETIWSAFRSLSYLHNVQFHAPKRSVRVVNAVLLRAVCEGNTFVAEKILQDAHTELGIRQYNAMTYSLMLDLYARQGQHTKFLHWCDEMERSGSSCSVFTVRALLRRLRGLVQVNEETDGDGEDDTDAESNVVEEEMRTLAERAARLLRADDIEAFADPADLARRLLRVAAQRGQSLDGVCLDHYLALCTSAGDLAFAFDCLDSAPTESLARLLDDDDANADAAFFHSLFAAAADLSPALERRARDLALRCATSSERGAVLSRAVLTAFCATQPPAAAVELLQALVELDYEPEDDELVVFLASTGVGETSDGVARLRDVGDLIVQAELDIGHASTTFLLQASLSLLRRSPTDAAEVLDLVTALLSDALDGSSRDQLRAFLETMTGGSPDALFIDQLLARLRL